MNFLNSLLLFLIFVSVTSYYLVPWLKGAKPNFKILISWWFGVFFISSLLLALIGTLAH